MTADEPYYDDEPVVRDRQPSDLTAEQSVLGGMLLSADAVAEVVEILRSEDFYAPKHTLIFDTVLDLYARGEPIDPVTLVGHLAEKGELTRAGGAPYIHTLIGAVPTAANAPYYARIVAGLAIQRAMVTTGQRIVQLGYSPATAGDLPGAVDLAQQMAFELGARTAGEDYVQLAEEVGPTMEHLDSLSRHSDVGPLGIPTGFTDLDRLLGGGLLPGQLFVIGARPGMGKSTLGLDILRHASIGHGAPGALFSLEMSRLELVMKIMAAEARVPLHELRAGRLDEQAWKKLADITSRLDEAPLWFDDSANQSLMEIRAKARRLKQRHGLRLVVIDYLQLMTGNRRVESRQQEVAELSRGLKLLAKELEVSVIAMSQLNRGNEQRTDKRPQLSDLRESGSVEQDADGVILIHREDYYDAESARVGEADFILAKHRNGPTDTVAVAFQGHFSRFVDMSTEAAPVGW